MLCDIEILPEETERHIQINDMNAAALEKIWPVLVKRYPGFALNLCFRNRAAPVEALAKIGATVLEDCVDYRVTTENYIPHEYPGIELLTLDDFDAFAVLHDSLPDMYWTSRRLRAVWEQDFWRIFILRENGKIIGYSMLRLYPTDLGEVFALELEAENRAEKDARFYALLSVAVQCTFDNKKSTALNQVERGDNRTLDAVKAVGFKECGYYIGYEVTIPV